MHINIHKRFEDVHNKAQNWNGQETDKKIRIYVKLLQIFFYILWLKKIECGG